MSRFMKQNRGFTLVEVLVVLAIIAILSASSAAGFSRISYANFKKVAGKINNEISDCRAVCMSHAQPAYTYIYNRGGDIYLYSTTNGEMNATALNGANLQRIASSNVSIYYVEANDTTDTYKKLNSGEFLEISFKLNGSFRTGAPVGAGSCNKTKFYRKLKIKKDNGGERIITMVQETGKHFMNE